MCNLCSGGPFKSNRGLLLHLHRYSWQCAIGASSGWDRSDPSVEANSVDTTVGDPAVLINDPGPCNVGIPYELPTLILGACVHPDVKGWGICAPPEFQD
jgi:hypothetical protein